MNMLITGGLGLLGNAIIKRVQRIKTDKIFVLDKLKNKVRFNYKYKNVFFIHGNFNNLNKIKKILCDKKIEAIFHLGAQTQVLDAIKNPYKTIKTNVMGTVNILESIRSINKSIVLIYSSSDKAYGEVKKKFYKENSKLDAIFPYDVSKSSSDLICQSYSKTYNLKIGIIRCANIYGPHDYNFRRIVPETIISALLKKKLIIRSSGKLKREYVFVDDVADAYYRVFNFLK